MTSSRWGGRGQVKNGQIQTEVDGYSGRGEERDPQKLNVQSYN